MSRVNVEQSTRRQISAKPFLKWPGGKRWLARYAETLIGGSKFRSYFEPFLGGGALFFALAPQRARLSDINSDLINTYVQVRNRPHQLIKLLKELPVDDVAYLKHRADTPASLVKRAVRFLYLNRTAFGGMYRLNQQGSFNVPFGGGQRTPEPLWNDNLLVSASTILKGADLQTCDFEDAVSAASAQDLVYCDPTYTVAHNNNGFIRYNERNFSWHDQRRLAETCRRLARLGTTVLVSNADHDDIVKLYRGARVHRLDRASVLCPDTQKRRTTTELLFHFKPKD
jgi:DNA adenine methylase